MNTALRFSEDVSVGLLTSILTLGSTGLGIYALKSATGTYGKYALFGPVDGLVCWLLIALAAWIMGAVTVARRWRHLASEGRLGEEGAPPTWSELGRHLVGYLKWQAGLPVVAALGATVFLGGPDAVAVGVLVGFFLLLPLGFLSPWVVGLGLLGSYPGSSKRSHSGGDVLLAVLFNAALLVLVALPTYTALDLANVGLGTWGLYWFGLACLGATHAQVALGGIVEKRLVD